ncbi:hypothetical protein M5K25_022842 [Dendrobium thyrsiflorum]|uniref:Uncharacterized protein n=1 Tax=Dendrobium thyrsiflorum TaxID=117978 RepID=A0ABD0UDC9_DENTH
MHNKDTLQTLRTSLAAIGSFFVWRKLEERVLSLREEMMEFEREKILVGFKGVWRRFSHGCSGELAPKYLRVKASVNNPEKFDSSIDKKGSLKKKPYLINLKVGTIKWKASPHCSSTRYLFMVVLGPRITIGSCKLQQVFGGSIDCAVSPVKKFGLLRYNCTSMTVNIDEQNVSSVLAWCPYSKKEFHLDLHKMHLQLLFPKLLDILALAILAIGVVKLTTLLSSGAGRASLALQHHSSFKFPFQVIQVPASQDSCQKFLHLKLRIPPTENAPKLNQNVPGPSLLGRPLPLTSPT